MMIDGQLLIAGAARRGQGDSFQAMDPSTGLPIAHPVFASATLADVEAAADAARQAFDGYRLLAADARAAFLEDAAARIDALGTALTERAMAETGLPRARLDGERARTVAQLRMFAALVRSGDALDARIEPALPERQPARSLLAMQRMAIGPVAVFGASNFPLAFSVAGGDTAAALAAGCPVVVKAHPAHPGTSEMVGRALQDAVAAAGLPAGVFSMITEAGHEMGAALVAHPAIQAVGFTGSRVGGLALMRIAARRPQPIPVYAEMSSVNPTLFLPGALAADKAEPLAREYIASLTLGAGQFCTNPGLALALAGPDLDRFLDAAASAVADCAPGVMLTAGIERAFEDGVARESAQPGAVVMARGHQADGRAQATLIRLRAADLLLSRRLPEEVFGPQGTFVVCSNAAELAALLEMLDGQLTATLHFDAEDAADVALARDLLPILERKAGRILANGFPTGVEVCDAMVHGGPFPATSDGRSTSVGTAAIERFLRPVCYQNLPDSLLPPALRAGNPLRVPRRVAGRSSA
ncbi:aldehyde dehydrogenase (NADP(+)) [Achromobacter xylosoxidans]|uniref:aldehyde dehydrogenase (NADP(+)) n=1 Tax=Alcaligenes xylosoxydans xylosoxydans TaxID=85698 RepID=UPI0022B9188D|nr:aldehyde dehydrogenase (NADP(+)) [Achromobacter xylosoxidans]MCZ8391548.1 aldehyde dehydrogenase (NADP(+)) [Achromobacter xylosoxidans]